MTEGPAVVPVASAETTTTLMAECPSFRLMPQTQQLRSLMTILRNKTTPTEDFVFFADRIIRLLVEAALEEMPHEPLQVHTPTGVIHEGMTWTLPYREHICGVSIVRAGESMEAGVRQVLKGVKIGKILIQRDEATAQAKLFYSKLPPNIATQAILLLDPMLATGGSAIQAVKVLADSGVDLAKVVFINLVCCPEGVRAMHAAYPQVRIVSSALDSHLDERKYIVPGLGDFGDRYFGTI
uniref:uracil phosphoribosyltransferase n=1 Tax=Alexandrium monilatum TaxID=311494 RepID=A0A7S4R9Q1_9DINO